MSSVAKPVGGVPILNAFSSYQINGGKHDENFCPVHSKAGGAFNPEYANMAEDDKADMTSGQVSLG